jgi:hypothetical protein
VSTSVYRSRSRTVRNRLLIVAGVVVLIATGFLIGRAQAGPQAPVPAAAPTTPAASPPPTASPSPSAAPSGGIDAYLPLQVEDAAEASGMQMQDTGDEGGGRNAGWVSNGDYLRFDNVNFGGTPPAAVNFRLAADTDASGRIEIRVDSATNPPLATLNTSRTGGWQNWRTETTDMSPVTGLHTLYVTFANDRPDDFVNLNWLVFRTGAG